MIRQASNAVPSILAIVFFTTHIIGCGESNPNDRIEAVEVVNDSENGLVKVSESGGRRVVSKYLTPEYLAVTEVESRGYGKESLDSLLSLYSQNLSFYVSVENSEKGLAAVGEIDSTAWINGMIDVEANRRMFRLEYGDSIWYPACALPESRIGEADQTWFVVFQIDARKFSARQRSLTIVYTPPNEGDVARFIYKIEDLVRPEFIASSN